MESWGIGAHQQALIKPLCLCCTCYIISIENYQISIPNIRRFLWVQTSPDTAGHMALKPMRTTAAANQKRCLPARFNGQTI
jgi:hypothetical protein